jgi:hypothetical protein
MHRYNVASIQLNRTYGQKKKPWAKPGFAKKQNRCIIDIAKTEIILCLALIKSNAKISNPNL